MYAEQNILAIDPGFDRIGFAILATKGKKPNVALCECYGTNRSDTFAKRLGDVVARTRHLIQQFSPATMVLEKVFFSKNQKTAFRVAETRGALIACATEYTIPVHEYTPNEVKLAVTGNGRDTKYGVMRMLPHLVELPDMDRRRTHDDAYDAVAIGITHLMNKRYAY